jgi:hypothetical protein
LKNYYQTLGDLADESEVLGWCLTQAGVNPVPEEEDSYSLLPTASAAASAGSPPINRVTPNSKVSTDSASASQGKPKQVPPPILPEQVAAPVEDPAAEPEVEEVENTTSGAVTEDATDEEDDENDIVDTIKNGNNVVAFFCKSFSMQLTLFSAL